MSNMQFKYIPSFKSGISALKRKGGKFEKAAKQAEGVFGSVCLGDKDPLKGLKVTNHGENRISKCVKYELIGACRLITIQDNGICVLCFVGDHNSCDKWLDNNRGFKPVVDGNGKLIPIYASDPMHREDSRPTGEAAWTSGPLFEKISDKLFKKLVTDCPQQLLHPLKVLESSCDDDELMAAVEVVSVHSKKLADDLWDVFSLLRSDRINEAKDRTKAALDEYKILDDLEPAEIDEVLDSQTIKSIPNDSPQYAKLFAHFAETAGYRDWMLFMHPDQEDVVDKNFLGPARLSGVSGSGKTCIVVQRAVRMARDYPGEKVLVLTLNRSLAGLIKELVNTCSTPEVEGQMDVQPFFAICQRLLHQFEPKNDRLYDDVTWKSQEHIDEVWREYYRCELNSDEAKVLLPLHDSLIARGINAENYIREEFDWVRSAVPGGDRSLYMDIPRTGRNYALDKAAREKVLAGLAGWEKKMEQVGITDYLGLAVALNPYLDAISEEYRCVLVDESQDFGTAELEIVRRLVANGENDLFMAGDAAQHVTPKHQKLKDAGIEAPGARSLVIKQNYRNSREILRVAHEVLVGNLTEQMVDNEGFEVLDPQFANFSGPDTICLDAESLEEEIGASIQYMREKVADNPEAKNCIAICGYSLYEIEQFAAQVDLPVLNRTTNLDGGNIFLSNLEQTKGFEFDQVCVLNVSAGVIPDASMPEDEQFRDLSRFYVAMTRAKMQLILSYTKQKSCYLDDKNVSDLLLDESWANYLENPEYESFGVPHRLNELRSRNIDQVSVAAMSGQQYLYTAAARGLPSEFIGKIRELIPGKRLMVRRGSIEVPKKWRSIADAAEWFRKEAFARKQWGPDGSVGHAEFERVFAEIETLSISGNAGGLDRAPRASSAEIIVEMPPADAEAGLKGSFHQAMLNIFWAAKTEAGYNAARFVQMVEEHGGLVAAKMLINASNVSDGYTALWERGRLDLTVEALVLDNQDFQVLFTKVELDACKQRLTEYRYEGKPKLG